MTLSMKLQVRQSQSLVMTPQLLQSIRLLQFGALELQAYIQNEIAQNPLLELAPPAQPMEYAPDAAPEPGTTAPAGALTGLEDGYAAFTDGAAADTRDDGPRRRSAEATSLSAGIDDIVDDRPGLLAHALAEQADILPPHERAIGAALAMHLDDAGYMHTPVADIAAALACPPARVQDCLDRLRDAVEPAGLFAASLAECLALQLARRGRLDPVMQGVLSHLDLLARRDFAALRRLTGEDEDGLLDVLAEIRRLDPKPGMQFSARSPEAVVPDLFVSANGSGGWRLRLNTRALPRLIVHNTYAGTVGGAKAGEERAYLAHCESTANWLVRSLDQRARTILKVAAEIVRRQGDFLIRGVQGLKPMTLASVAESVALHESTVSRVTANKFIATPRGTFELKFFFTVAIAATDGGDAHSAESVKLRIRRLVDAETAGEVLSDDEIALQLKADGVDLARRTVAKYRESLGISSSVQRRREWKARRPAS